MAQAALRGLEVPVIEVDSRRWRPSVAHLVEVWSYREVLLSFAVRYFKVKYKQAFIGVGWSVVQPILASLLFSLFMGRFAKLPSEGLPYFVFCLGGMVAWSFFSTAVANSGESLIRDQGLVRKVYFPREALPLATVLASLADLPAALGVFLVVSLLFGIPISITWLLLPIPIVLLILCATGLGFVISALNVYYRDIRYVLPFLLQLLLFASPVFYSIRLVPDKWRFLYGTLNPVATAIEDFRRVVLHGGMIDPGRNLAAFGISLALLLIGYYTFKSLERGFADHL